MSANLHRWHLPFATKKPSIEILEVIYAIMVFILGG
jgi:hypothetical protein